jgi:hypothetical protein
MKATPASDPVNTAAHGAIESHPAQMAYKRIKRTLKM